MLALFFRHKYFMFVILTLLFCSILCQILLGVLYRRLIRETENMSATKNKSLQQLKLKFTSCRQLHETIPNVPVFVDKFLNQISLGKIPVAFSDTFRDSLRCSPCWWQGSAPVSALFRRKLF